MLDLYVAEAAALESEATFPKMGLADWSKGAAARRLVGLGCVFGVESKF